MNLKNLITITPNTDIENHEKLLRVTYWNARSVKNKTFSLNDYLSDDKPDLLLLTETWLSKEEKMNKSVLGLLLPEDFNIQHIPRPDGREGGGVSIVFQENIPVQYKFDNYNLNFKQFENISRLICFKSSSVFVCVVYRPQPTRQNKLSIRCFWPEWTKFLSKLISKYPNFVIFGDLNFHLDSKENSQTKKFNNILAEFGLKQLITDSTHVKGHILDVVIVPDESNAITNFSVFDPCFSNDYGHPCNDHYAIKVDLIAEKMKPKPKTIVYRNWKKVNLNSFQQQLHSRLLVSALNNSITDMNLLIDCYQNSLNKLSYIHAPEKTITVKNTLNP